MNPYLVFILTVLVASYFLDLVVSFLEIRSLQPELPAEFKDVYDEEKYRKSQEYTRVTTRFSLIQDTITLVVTLLFILAGGFNTVDLLARSVGWGSISTGLLFTGMVILLSFVLGLPFSLYSTFVIEERFGFNKTTVKTFFLDLLKGVLLAILIGGPLLAAVLWFFEITGTLAWIYCWLAVTLFTFILQFLAPVLIMPLFNKFTPLEDGELKEGITEYAAQQDFAIQGIYTMDGSKRSTRLNAFFTGFGRFRRIVFFDTLVEKLLPQEIIAVLAHEMGHFKQKHILKMMGLSILQTGLMFYILSLFLGNAQLFAAFGMEHISVYAGLIFFGFLYTPVSMLLSIFFHIYSRKNEYQADAWAVETTADQGEGLINGLKKLSVHNLSNLTPHPFNVFIHYSHPPVLQRIQAIRGLAQKKGGA
ncbi:MAG: M48 family metallopeptidase [Candidatus Electrothrix aestuarii]|uniref:M48 family metallopeptidase n=1 Tax=Candidatus Electrothrix aestuarii TaxID=3062594 RepID=A0AAU8LRF3_9BACT|nr:M48 family metallopeptidase [Candidatus Electrothrix aestuarii]